MVKYLVTKHSKLVRRTARRAKESARMDWQKPDMVPSKAKPSGATVRRLVAVLVALVALSGVANARGSGGSHGGWSHHESSDTSRGYETAREKNTR
jgi:uncharacterized membrane protein